MSSNLKWSLGLIASVLVALAAQPDAVPDPLKHYMGVAGIIGAAITGYMIRPTERRDEAEQRPRLGGERKDDPPLPGTGDGTIK